MLTMLNMTTSKRLLLLVFIISISLQVKAAPSINGSPKIVTPDLLEWPGDFPKSSPNLSEATSNRLNDLHGNIAQCDLVLSTAGNYHMALRELWQSYILKNASTLNIKTWFYTTSPPISVEQASNKTVEFGNLKLNCMPQVAVGPKKLIEKLQSLGLTVGAPVKIIKNYGNVIFVKKGNPKKIKSVWDLGREDVTLVTPNPKMEPGSFGNFSNSIYNIAKNDANPPKGMTAEKLFNKIFNSDQNNCGKGKTNCAWVSGKRIMHREQPWAVYAGHADAGFIFYHVAQYLVKTFPNEFEIVPLGGTIEKPQPLKGNKISTLLAVRIKSDWTQQQKKAQEFLMKALSSEQFTKILIKHKIRRP